MIDTSPELLNLNWANSLALEGALPVLLETKQSVLNRAIIPLNKGTNKEKRFDASQYRHEDFNSHEEDVLSFIAYPVMDSFAPNANVAGVLSANIYWRLFFSQVLPASAGSFICVLENSFDQRLSFRLEGPHAKFLGQGDWHDAAYESLMGVTDTSEYVVRLQDAAHRSYSTVSLNTEYGKYTLRVYPTKETEDMFLTKKPWVYTSIVVAVSALTSIFFVAFVYFVERRQRIVMRRVMENAAKAAAAERDLNEFLAHEIRNPLASAMVAHGFVKSTVEEPGVIADDAIRESVQADQNVVSSSLHFIDDFLRSMLLMYRASANKLEVELVRTNLYEQCFEPVGNILQPHNTNIQFSIDCPRDLEVMTDGLRLKQILLNLGKNASKFVSSGFIRLRAAIVDGKVELSVEDSGPGIAPEKRKVLFTKYQTTLEVVSQGNGIGLCLCKNLMDLLKGELSLDESYDSGIPGCPGARFVVKLNMPPLTDSKEVLPQADANGSLPLGMDGVSADTTANTSGEEDAAQPSILPETLSVLFVDDDAILRKLFVRSLRKVRPNWTIKEAASGEVALGLFRNHRNDVGTGQAPSASRLFDLIFIDQYMASSSADNAEPRALLGTETVAAIRALGVQSTMCGLSANDMGHEFIAAGADCFTLKPLPFERHALESELIRITDRIRSENDD